jgi:hypothetical protein
MPWITGPTPNYHFLWQAMTLCHVQVCWQVAARCKANDPYFKMDWSMMVKI